jgi:hypothetical protein
LAGELLFDEKIRQNAALFWFGLRNVVFPQIFLSQAKIQRTIVDSPAFLSTFGGKGRGLCSYKP